MMPRTRTNLQERRVGLRLGLAMLALGASLTWAGPGWTQGAQVTPDYAFYRGKTLDIVVANAAGTTIANTIAILRTPLEKALSASVRINYNTAPTVAAMNAGATQAADGLHLGALAVGTALANVVNNTGIAFDLTKLSWVGAGAGDMNAVWACGQKAQWSTFEEFLNSKDPVTATGVFGGSSYLINIALLKGLGREYKMLTGYTSSTIAVSCTRGDANWKVSALGNYTNSAGTAIVPGAHPLLMSGKAPAGSPLKFLDSIPTLDEWVKTYQAKTPDQKKMLDLAVGLFATDAPNGALYAPPGAPPERMAALREAFATVVKDPTVQETWLKIGVPAGQYFTAEQIQEFLKTTISDLPRIRELLEIK
jgi:tripartite-type tricarboxylate transporter receptor subunit TctC